MIELDLTGLEGFTGRIPPDVWSPEFGTEDEYVRAVNALAEWAEQHPHRFRRCTFCKCELCMDCRLLETDEIHVKFFDPEWSRSSG